ncbi:MAG: hypothetical protein ABSC11_14715, partial [Smithella sp.]
RVAILRGCCWPRKINPGIELFIGSAFPREKRNNDEEYSLQEKAKCFFKRSSAALRGKSHRQNVYPYSSRFAFCAPGV